MSFFRRPRRSSLTPASARLGGRRTCRRAGRGSRPTPTWVRTTGAAARRGRRRAAAGSGEVGVRGGAPLQPVIASWTTIRTQSAWHVTRTRAVQRASAKQSLRPDPTRVSPSLWPPLLSTRIRCLWADCELAPTPGSAPFAHSATRPVRMSRRKMFSSWQPQSPSSRAKSARVYLRGYVDPKDQNKYVRTIVLRTSSSKDIA